MCFLTKVLLPFLIPINTKPTGFFLEPPLGPAIPVIETLICALEILDNNMDNLQIMGFENKFDAMRSVYDMTDQFHKDINGGVE